MKEYPTVFENKLVLLEQKPCGQGAEKKVFKMQLGSKIVAGKIFFDLDADDNKVDKPLEAVKEFEAYLYFRQSSIGIFIPEPLGFIKNNEGTVGLYVDWRPGIELIDCMNTDNPKPLTSKEVDELENCYMELPGPLFPESDMMSEGNLCFSNNCFPRVWLAECDFASDSYPREKYEAGVKWSMNYLRENYVS